ncbi:hypothetical protein RJ640_004047 [Escallonia rubra]|uniref:Pentatricopeptide repeat-containing protein n=1 Tax=Escallonia rubra TaxID=112253 RepID=A0AA88UGC2_9ASTE|nr:hypothetical protein RJ640_004047 [Escallonia rubra]
MLTLCSPPSKILRKNLLSLRLTDGYLTRHFLLHSVTFHSAQDVYACNVKIGALSRSGNIDAARQLFDVMLKRDVVTWNAMITGYWKNGCFLESKRLFEVMPMRNVVSWNSMIAGCIQDGRIDDAYMYFNSMPERNVASWNAMISGFLRCDRVEDASRLFEEMPRRNVISYTAMIDGYAHEGEIERARALFDCMECKNAVSWTVMISGYVENERLDEARELFERMPGRDVVAVTAMITGYCKEGKMETARILFEEIQCRDCVSFNAMIAGYVQNENCEEALKLHVQMLRSGLKPDHSTLVSVLTACSSLASLKEGRQIHAVLLKCGLDSHVSVCNTLITTYSRCGSILESESAFAHINSPDLVSWNTIIAAFAQHGLYEKALALFKRMELLEFEPDGITFLSLLSACGHAGRTNESMQWFDLMVDNYKIAPRSEHYACLVDILGRAGQVETAYKVIQEMPFEAVSGVWNALLAGCRVCSNLELGYLAAKKVVELDPKNSGGYVMLSNICAASGLWKEVTRVRSLMKEYGVKKQPAYSWMEIDNEVHYFLGGDISHRATEEIHSELKHINLQMKTINDIAEIVSTVELVQSGSFDFRQKQLSSVLSRTINASKLCRGDALGSQVDGDALISPEQKSFKVGSSSKNRKDKTSRMQQHIDQLQEELNRTMEQYRAAEDESARAREREAKTRMSQPFSPSEVEDVFEELKTLKELLSNSQRELGIKDKGIESLKVELEKAKQFELELAQREAAFERLKEELTNAKASEARAIGLSSERNKRIQELEAEVERGKISESKMFDSVVSQSKQLEETKVELEQSKLEIASLQEELEKLQMSSSRHSEHLHSNKDAFESLKSELQLAKENLARAQEGEKLASLKVKSVVDEIGLLKNELKLATDAEEKSKKAMDDLALALKEVATASNQEKEKHNLTQAELEHVKSEAEQLKVMVRGIEDRYQKLLDEAKKETELHQNTADRLRLEAEETLLAWNGKEMGFVGCIRRAEEERALAQHENTKLAESLKAAENTTRVAREESYKLRDILKQALNEASVAKEAASIARDENSQLKDCLDEKDEALHFLTRENERLRINETAAQENIKELKRLLSAASSERTEEKEQEGMFKSPNSSPNSVFEEHLEDIKPNTPFRFDLNELKVQNEHEHVDETVEDEDPARAEALKGSIFDTPVSPTSEPQTPKSGSTYHRRGSSSAETLNSEDFDHLDGTAYDDTDGDRTLHRRRRSALFRKFGDLIMRKSFHKREPE